MYEAQHYIDDCRHSFEALASHVLPAHMERLRMALKTPWSMSDFVRPGFGPRALARSFGLDGDFSGCYTLLEGSRPRYVGISRSVLSRVRQHVVGRTHFDASLAYRIAQSRSPNRGQRSRNMSDPAFLAEFQKAQSYLRTFHVAVVAIDNPLELYVFEAYAAIALGTSEWNSFRTH
jgi:hypothetical protein